VALVIDTLVVAVLEVAVALVIDSLVVAVLEVLEALEIDTLVAVVLMADWEVASSAVVRD